MSGRGSGGGPSRGASEPSLSTWARDGVGAILVVLALGLAFRVIIAYAYPGTGLQFDLVSFRFWADNLASQGLAGFYDRPFLHDYTPGYLYVLAGIGWLSQAIAGAPGHVGDMIKLPPIIADVAIGWLVWSMALELGASRRAALIGAALAVANPISASRLFGSRSIAFLKLAIAFARPGKRLRSASAFCHWSEPGSVVPVT